MSESIANSISTVSITELGENLSIVDTFQDELASGRVVGSRTAQGVIRKGTDTEGVIGIDRGALRIRPLIKPGWGRAGIAYGPYERRNGLAFGVSLLNGHNISRATPLPDSFKMRLWRWLIASETEKPSRRLWELLRGAPQRGLMWRRLLQWLRTAKGSLQVRALDENLAVGWFPVECTQDPLQQGNSITVHAVIPEGGELWLHNGLASLRTCRGLQNVPVHYIVVLRERGAAYYVATIPGVPGLPAYPAMRLLAIDSFRNEKSVYAGVQQSVLGEIGFRADTRVYRAQVGVLQEFSTWYGSAHGADLLTGEGALHLSCAEAGGTWSVSDGMLNKSERGVYGMEDCNAATLKLNASVGLIHVLIETGDKPVERAGVVWRAQDEENFWCVEASSSHCRLSVKENGVWSRFPEVKHCFLAPNAENSLQVADDGESIQVYLNGQLVYGTTLCDTRLHDATGVGIRIAKSEGTAWLRAFEAHPREITIPREFNSGEPRRVTGGCRLVLKDGFEGVPGDLAGHTTTVGGKKWNREIGQGVVELTGRAAARVRGSVEKPCPGRTAYMVDWENSRFADVQVTITPPGKQKGMKDEGRAGLIFWQDPRNYVILSAFIGEYAAMSIAAFFQYEGFEELYDAVWSNVGRRMHLGVPHDFRVTFEGELFQASIDGEPVLYRALTDVYPDWNKFLIRRVGIVANWEWGQDTGSVFQNFTAWDKV